MKYTRITGQFPSLLACTRGVPSLSELYAIKSVYITEQQGAWYMDVWTLDPDDEEQDR